MGFSLGSRSLVFTLPTVTGSADGNTQYKNLVTNTASANLVGFWPMDEISGTSADNAEGTAARDGTFSNVTLNAALNPFGGAAGSWNGSTSYCNVQSASLSAALSGAEGSFIAWAKAASGAFTDSTGRYVLSLQTDTNNYVRVRKETINYRMGFYYAAGGTVSATSYTSVALSAGWNCYGITWSASNDRVRAFINGDQFAADLTGLGTYSGSPGSSIAALGALTTTPLNVWSGNLALAALYDTELTAAQMRALAFNSLLTRIVVVGDSISDGSSTWAEEVSVGYESGAGVLYKEVGGGDTIISDMDAHVVAAVNHDATKIIIQLGVNDNNAGDMGALQAEAEENIAELKTNHPRASVYWFILPSYASNSPGAALVDKSNIRTAVAAACTAQGATYWDSVTSPWIDAEDTSDGVHPTAAGHTKVATQVLARL